MIKNITTILKRLPIYGWVGLIFIGIFWYLNWALSGPRTHWFFFPLWLGYCITVDALAFARRGDSLLTRNPRAYVGLFLLSIFGWWLFEVINLRTQNWSYVGRELFSKAEFNLYASLSFSTVIPAVFGTAELVGTFEWINQIRKGAKLKTQGEKFWRFFLACIVMFLLRKVLEFCAISMWVSLV